MEINDAIKRRTSLSIQQKIEIYDKLQSGASVNILADEYRVHVTTIRCIRRNGIKMRQFADQGIQLWKRKKLRRPEYEDLEDRLYMWCLERKNEGDFISDALLRKKALEFNTEFGGSSAFKASTGWLIKFKSRRNIHLLNIEEKGSTDAVAAEEFIVDFTRRMMEEGIEYKNIYNMDVTGLMWKALPTKTSVHGKGKRIEGTKLKKDRITVGLCTNATGTHKLAPLLIYRFKKPRALRSCKDRLPVIFKTQKQASMDHEIFVDWFEHHFKPAVEEHQLQNNAYGKVVLLLDNYRRQKIQLIQFRQDDHFEVVFLPPNTTSLLQPMDQGVIERTKKSFRHKMLKHVLSYPGGLREFYIKYSLKECINLLYEAWTEISASSIRNSWKALIKTIIGVTTMQEDQNDPLEPQLEEIIGAIIKEQTSQEIVHEFLLKCEEAENEFSEEDETQEEGDEDESEDTYKKQYEEERRREQELCKIETDEEAHDNGVLDLEEYKAEISEARYATEEQRELKKYRGGSEGQYEMQEQQEYKEFTEEQRDREKQREEKENCKNEIEQALEILTKYTEQAPQYIKLIVESLKDYLLAENGNGS